MNSRRHFDRSAYTGVGEAPPNSHAANPLAIAAAGVVGGRESSSRCSSLSSAAAATALRRHSFTQESLGAIQRLQTGNNVPASPSTGGGLKRSSSVQSRSTTIKKTNPDRTMSLTRRTVSQYGSFEIVKEDTKIIPAPPVFKNNNNLRQIPRSTRGPPSILSDSDLAVVSEEEPLDTAAHNNNTFLSPNIDPETGMIKHNPPPRTLSPIKPALKDSASTVSSDNEGSISGKHKHRVSFFSETNEDQQQRDPFQNFASPSPKLKPQSPTPQQQAKTHAAQLAYKAPQQNMEKNNSKKQQASSSLAVAAAAKSQKKKSKSNNNNEDDENASDSGDSIYSDCEENLAASNSLMQVVGGENSNTKKPKKPNNSAAAAAASKRVSTGNSRTSSPKPSPSASSNATVVPTTTNNKPTNKQAHALSNVKTGTLDANPRPSDADDDDSDDSDNWRKQRAARRKVNSGGGRIRTSLRDPKPTPISTGNNNTGVPTPKSPVEDDVSPAFDVSTMEIPASVMEAAAQNVALTTRAMDGDSSALNIERPPSSSSFKREKGGGESNNDDGHKQQAAASSSNIQNGFRLSLRNEAPAAAVNNNTNNNNSSSSTKPFKSRFEDSDTDDDDDYAAPPLASKADLIAPKEKSNQHNNEHKRFSFLSPKREAKVLIPRKKHSKDNVNESTNNNNNATNNNSSGLAPITSASEMESPINLTGGDNTTSNYNLASATINESSNNNSTPKTSKSVPTMRASSTVNTKVPADYYTSASGAVHQKKFRGLRRLFRLDN